MTRRKRKLKRLTKHHNIAKSRGGRSEWWNLYIMSEEHHQAYHKLFRNMTLREAAEALLRMERMHNPPRYKKGECE